MIAIRFATGSVMIAICRAGFRSLPAQEFAALRELKNAALRELKKIVDSTKYAVYNRLV